MGVGRMHQPELICLQEYNRCLGTGWSTHGALADFQKQTFTLNMKIQRACNSNPNPNLNLNTEGTLNLTGCNKVKDVSTLGSVHTLSLNCCSKVRDVSALSWVHTLDLTNCDNVQDISMLEHVRHLTLDSITRVANSQGRRSTTSHV